MFKCKKILRSILLVLFLVVLFYNINVFGALLWSDIFFIYISSIGLWGSNLVEYIEFKTAYNIISKLIPLEK